VIEETLKEKLEEKQCLEVEEVSKRYEEEKREAILTSHLKEIPKEFNNLEAKFGQQERSLC
jgi:hypothetical protein